MAGFNTFLFVSSLIILPLVVSAYGYGDLPKSYEHLKKTEFPTIYGFQGLIYCRSGYDLNPLQGALTKITCTKKGSETEISMKSPKTDSNGYFLALIKPEELGKGLKPTDCEVFLYSSPSETCNVATDVDMGISGASPVHSRVIDGFMNTYDMELYSVSPFVYTTISKEY